MNLPPGTVVRVTWFDTALANLPKERVQGTFATVDGATLTVETRSGPRRIPRAQIHRVDAAAASGRRDSVVNGALIGGLVGVGIAVVMAGTSGSSDPMPYPISMLVVGGGIAVGALTDSIMKTFDYRTIYLWDPSRRRPGAEGRQWRR